MNESIDTGPMIDGYAAHLTRRGRQASTVQRYRQLLWVVARFMHPRPLVEMTAADFATFLRERQLSTSMATRYRTVVRGFFGWVIAEGYVATTDPTWRRPAEVARKPGTSNPWRAPDGRARRRLRVGVELGEDTERVIAAYRDHGRRRGLRPLSIKKNDQTVRLFAEHVHPRPLVEMTADDIDRFLDARKLTARTRYAYVSMAHAFFEWAVVYGHAERDPTLTVVRARFPRVVPRPIPDEDLEHALRIAAPREAAMMALAAFHGLRAAEIANIQREDIIDRQDEPVVIVTEGKGGHQRVVPLHPVAWERYIQPWVGVRRTGWLFVDENGRALPPYQVSHRVNGLLHDAGIASTIHMLRHFYGTKVYRASRDLRVTQALLGHASPNTTIGYVAWSSLDAREAVEAIKVT